MSTEYFGRAPEPKEYCIDQDCMYADVCEHNVAVSKLRIEQIADRKEIDSISCIADGFARRKIDDKKAKR